MTISTLSTKVILTSGIATVGLVTTAAAAAGVAAPTTVPNVVGTEVVGGTLSPSTFQKSLNEAYLAKKVAEAVAIREAVTVKWQAEAAQGAAAVASAPTGAAGAAQTSGGGGDASAWANSAKSMSVKNCESGNNYSTNTGNGYYGAWQFDIASWNANGGAAYAATPDQAPAWAQDQVAYNYYQQAGWGPWSCG